MKPGTIFISHSAENGSVVGELNNATESTSCGENHVAISEDLKGSDCIKRSKVPAPGPLSDLQMVTDKERLIADLIDIYDEKKVEYDAGASGAETIDVVPLLASPDPMSTGNQPHV